MKDDAEALAVAADTEAQMKEAWESALATLEVAKERFARTRKHTLDQAQQRDRRNSTYYAGGWMIKTDNCGAVCHMERALAL